MSDTCGTCRYFIDGDYCQRRAPVLPDGPRGHWPVVRSADWCGEWAEKDSVVPPVDAKCECCGLWASEWKRAKAKDHTVTVHVMGDAISEIAVHGDASKPWVKVEGSPPNNFMAFFKEMK